MQVEGKLQEVIPPDCGVPIHPPIRVEPAPRTAYDGQTVYRMKLFRFTARERNLKDVSDSRSLRFHGRNLPPGPAGSELEVDVWLDENKVLQATVKHPGSGPSAKVEASLSEVGSDALYTDLLDRALEAEALLEANRDNRSPLFEELREALQSARSALSSKDRESAETCLETLGDGIEQATQDRGQCSVEDRVLGWVSFYHHDLLPTFWDLFDDEKRQELQKRMRAIHIMTEAKCPNDELEEGLYRLNEKLVEGETGIIISAYRQASVMGVPRRLGRDLEKLSQRAAFHCSRGEAVPYQGVKRELRRKMDEAETSSRGWRDAGEINVVRPDLEIRKAATS